jgi:UDP-N-acetylmuramoyl-L-alanyl-D-glutamate--2,6-diaminopimelate ligase
MSTVLLGKMFSELGLEIDDKLKDVEIKNIAYDSRKVEEGSLFVAVKGFKSDGHAYIENAFEKGAVLAVGEEDRDCDRYVKVESARKFLAASSAAFYNNPAKDLKIVGITGTNGKTTISYLIKQILELKGCKCALIGTNQIMIGDEAYPSERTTPESRELQELFAKMRDAKVEYVIMEVSSHSLELDRVYGIEFETAVFTNLTQDHLDFHKTMENYAAAKAKLFKMSKSAVINADDIYSHVMLESAVNTITYSIENESDLKAENIRFSPRGVIFDAGFKGVSQLMRLGIPGRFSVYNALGAIGAALALGLGLDDAQKGLILARGVKGRLEVVPTATDYTIIIDYAHTPDGLENVISAVKGFAEGRVITLFGCGGDRDRGKRPIMGEIAERLSDIAIVTSDNPRSEEPKAIIDEILTGMKGDNHIVVENRKEAIQKAISIAQKGDIVILAGKGHETYQILKNETIHFDEREIVKETVMSMK